VSLRFAKYAELTAQDLAIYQRAINRTRPGSHVLSRAAMVACGMFDPFEAHDDAAYVLASMQLREYVPVSAHHQNLATRGLS